MAFWGTVPIAASAQLRQTVWRADAGQIYQILQYLPESAFGTGAEEIRITSIAANSFSAGACGSPAAAAVGDRVEALASGPIAGSRPLDLAFKSTLIADASVPCFDSAANDGLGAVCIGPGCDSDCSCPGGDCMSFSVTDAAPLALATPDAPAAQMIVPQSAPPTQCEVSSHVSYGFGPSTFPTTQAQICASAPADGVRLPGTPSTFAGGSAGTTIVFAYEALPEESVGLAAAGFGIDTDGQSPFGCDQPGRIVASVMASENQAPPPPPPPIAFTSDDLRCQSAIGRSAVRFTSRAQRALNLCRGKILAGQWQLQAHDCVEHPEVERSLRSAARMARSAIRSACRTANTAGLLTCGDNVDELFAPSFAGGCLYWANLNAAEQAATVTFGF